MRTSVGQVFLGVMAFASAAWSADAITGRVMAGGSPAAGVRVTHIRTGIADTTVADGLFELKLPKVSLLDRAANRAPGFALRGNRLEIDNPERGLLTAALFAMDGRAEAVLFRGEMQAGSHSLALAATDKADPGLHILSVAIGGTVSSLKVLVTARGLEAKEGFQSLAAPALRKAAADNDSVVFAGKQLFTMKKNLTSFTAQDMGDVVMEKNPIGTSNIVQDKFDQFIMNGVHNRGLDESLGMVLKAMIVIESSFKVDAISMWDTQLPCGTHSYGLIQVTPGCERGYATLNGVAATASVSGGLNGNPAVLSWFNAADKTSGNTIVQESGITIDLVTNSASQYWATSAFNPAYSIDHGAKAVADVMGSMKGSFGGCSAANYVSMTLAGYNQGESTVSGCTAYSANGQKYQESVLTQYRNFCKTAGVTAIY